jgi:cytochrome P450
MCVSSASRGIAARMGRWSADHRRRAITGWLAFMLTAIVIGSSVGQKTIDSHSGDVRRPPDSTAYDRGMDLPAGPRAPAVWQTIAWMTRPGAFLTRVHARYGDPATIRTYWTEEPMVLFSSPDGVRSVFRLDPAIAPAGRSWEFLRPFAGPHSILLLDGEEHLRERRLMQEPFHGEKMRAFAPMIASLARAELETWRGRVTALDRMRELTLEIILRVVLGARDAGEVAALRGAIDDTLATVRSLPWVLAMAVTRNDSRPTHPTAPPRPRSPWGRFRLAVERFDALLFELLARAREPATGAGQGGDSMLSVLLAQRDERGNPPTVQHLRDQLVALLVGGHDSSAASLAWAFERLARHPAAQTRLREGDPAYLDAVVKESLRIRPALTIAPRLLLEPAQITGRTVPAGVQVAACLWLACRRPDLWPRAGEFRPERWLGEEPAPNPLSWIPFGGGVRRCAGAPFAEMEMREVLRAAAELPITLRPARPEPERARRSMLVLVPHRGAEVVVG